MIILGIDPSLETGLAIVSFENDTPVLIASTCIKPGTVVPKGDRLGWIVRTVADWTDAKWSKGVEWDLVAIEFPNVGRSNAHPLQWRLIGRLEELFGTAPVVQINPGRAKQAVGLSYHSPRKPVPEVERLLGMHVPLSDVKYVREAVADAVAVAVAAYHKAQEGVA